MTKKEPIYEIGDLITEKDSKYGLVTGLVVDIKYSSYEQQFNYIIQFSDMGNTITINESVLHFRILNEIWDLHRVLKND